MPSRIAAAAFAILTPTVLAVSAPAQADREAANYGHVITDTWGTCYARSVPSEAYGNGGRTDIYRIGSLDEPDILVASFDFFSQQLFLDCQVADGEGGYDVSVVALGPWPRGSAPNHETVALAMFYGSDEIARYSTKDIAGDRPGAVSCTISHYQVIDRVKGFGRDLDGNEVIILTTVDGQIMSFDLITGALLHTEPGLAPGPGGGECP
ncbi:MAG: hypothetical protein AAF563_10565 [Pseudomonadota bacterium]